MVQNPMKEPDIMLGISITNLRAWKGINPIMKPWSAKYWHFEIIFHNSHMTLTFEVISNTLGVWQGGHSYFGIVRSSLETSVYRNPSSHFEAGSSVKPYFSIGHWSTPVRGPAFQWHLFLKYLVLSEVGSSNKPYFSIGHWSTPVRGTSSEIMTSLVWSLKKHYCEFGSLIYKFSGFSRNS